MPHALALLPARQLLPLQQPAQPVPVLHTQRPPLHCVPGPQAAPNPQWQPPNAQLSAVAGLQAGPLPHLQVPPEQLSDKPPHDGPLPQ